MQKMQWLSLRTKRIAILIRKTTALLVCYLLFLKFMKGQKINNYVFFFSQNFKVYLSVFRPGYGCQNTLLRIIENWTQALDENKYVANNSMDLSKAFDCLPHDLLLL